MKKLKPCKTCGKEVAATAETCPHCGQSHPTIPIDTKAVYGVVALIVIGGWFYALYYFGLTWESITDYYKAVFELQDAIKEWEGSIKARENAGE